MHLNKPLDLADFDDPELAGVMRQIHGWAAADPITRYAKGWEMGMTVLALQRHGALRPDAELLGVGAGREPTLFYLTTRCRRVFATDMYAGSGSWVADAAPAMLVNPEGVLPQPNPYPFDRRRLVVQHMDGRDLRYPDGSFDGLFSCGSIEHFGNREDIARAAREMARVTKPGGIVTLATEFRIDGPPGDGIPGTVLFSPDMVQDWIVRPSGLQPVDPLDFRVAPATIEHVYPLEEAVHKGIRPISIALSAGGYRFTSIFLALRKV